MDSTSLLHINYLPFNPYIIKSVVNRSIKIILHFQKGLEEIKQICIETKKCLNCKIYMYCVRLLLCADVLYDIFFHEKNPTLNLFKLSLTNKIDVQLMYKVLVDCRHWISASVQAWNITQHLEIQTGGPTRSPGGGLWWRNCFILDHAIMEMIVMVL